MDEDFDVGGVETLSTQTKPRSLNPRQIGFLAVWPKRRKKMPKVAGKRFPYTKSGKAAAEKAEKKQMSKREMMKRMKAAR